MSTDITIITAAANIVHIIAWANVYEEEGGTFGAGAKIEDYAPPVPVSVTEMVARSISADLLARCPEGEEVEFGQDIGHALAGSGGGSGYHDMREVNEIHVYYYVGDDGTVYGRDNQRVSSAEDFGLPEQEEVTVAITYEIVDEESAQNGEAAEHGFVVNALSGGGDDLPAPPIVGPVYANWRVDNNVDMNLHLPRNADVLRHLCNEFGRGIRVNGEDWRESATIQTVNDALTGSTRTETVHIKGDRNAIKRALR